jgi:DNA invertase Pin-like site-specific DNA recombinase
MRIQSKLKAVAYLRVSSKQQAQDDKNGFERQLQIIRRYASRNNIEIVKVHREAFTGKEAKRPVFIKMVTELVSNGASVVLVDSQDRFSRDTVNDLAMVETYLAAKGIDLIDCSKGLNVTAKLEENPYTRAMIQFFAVASELERNIISYRLAKGRKDKSAKAGRYVAGRKATYSLRFKNRLLKLRSLGKSYSQIAQILNKQGVKTASNKPWYTHLVAGVIKDYEKGRKE